MSPRTALATVAASAVVFALLGGIAGHAIGMRAFEFDRGSKAAEDVAPIVAAAYGAGEGLLIGGTLAIAVVVFHAWRDFGSMSLRPVSSDVHRRDLSWSLIGIVVGVLTATSVAWLSGSLGAWLAIYEVETVNIESYYSLRGILEDGRFPDLRIEKYRNSPFVLEGSVTCYEELTELRARLKDLPDFAQTSRTLAGVRVAE